MEFKLSQELCPLRPQRVAPTPAMAGGPHSRSACLSASETGGAACSKIKKIGKKAASTAGDFRGQRRLQVRCPAGTRSTSGAPDVAGRGAAAKGARSSTGTRAAATTRGTARPRRSPRRPRQQLRRRRQTGVRRQHLLRRVAAPSPPASGDVVDDVGPAHPCPRTWSTTAGSALCCAVLCGRQCCNMDTAATFWVRCQALPSLTSRPRWRSSEWLLRLVARSPGRHTPAAQCSLGVMCDNDTGVPKDFAKAARWCRLAADHAVKPRMHAQGWHRGPAGLRRGDPVVLDRRGPGARQRAIQPRGAQYKGTGVPHDLTEAARARLRPRAPAGPGPPRQAPAQFSAGTRARIAGLTAAAHLNVRLGTAVTPTRPLAAGRIARCGSTARPRARRSPWANMGQR